MGPPKLFIIIETKTKSKNIGTILRCAVAFNVTAVCIYGYRTFSTHGAHGSQKHIPVLHFYYLKDCIDFVRSQGCQIYCVSPRKELSSSAIIPQTIENFVFVSSAAFIVGSGSEFDINLSEEQLLAADSVIYCAVPNNSFENMLHYNAKLSICLEAFVIQARYSPIEYSGEKYQINKQREDRLEAELLYDDFIRNHQDERTTTTNGNCKSDYAAYCNANSIVDEEFGISSMLYSNIEDSL